MRDIALVRRLSQQGVPLHTESALTNRSYPLRGALLHLLIGGQSPTYVWKAEQGNAAGFVQLLLREDAPHAQIVCLGVDGARRDERASADGRFIDEGAWLELLDALIVAAGRQGVHSLVAEVGETGPELPVLRQAGFAVYTRQDVWQLSGPPASDSEATAALARRRSVDDWDIQLLYANTVPRLVQLAEPAPPLEYGQIWVLHEEDELAAFVHVSEGESASWLRFYLNPNARSHTDEIVDAALARLAPTPEQPVYCCVRRYQSYLQSSLERAGLTLWASQAVMVKHTVQRVERPVPELGALLETQAPITPGPTTFSRQPSPVPANGCSRLPVAH